MNCSPSSIEAGRSQQSRRDLPTGRAEFEGLVLVLGQSLLTSLLLKDMPYYNTITQASQEKRSIKMKIIKKNLSRCDSVRVGVIPLSTLY